MDRQQREIELRALLGTPRGEDELRAVFERHAGRDNVQPLPSGTQLIEAILNFEYQSEGVPEQGRGPGAGEGPSRPAPKKAEPGDVKFAEPPGAESPGG